MWSFDLATWLLVFLRVSVLLAVFPIFSIHNIPVQVRIGLAALTSFLLTPLVPAVTLSGLSLWQVIGIMVQEVGVGLLLGFVASVLFYMLEFAGGVIGAELGMNYGVVIDPMNGRQSQAPGMVLFLLGGVLFFTLDLHQWLLLAIQVTYRWLPPGGAHLKSALFHDVVGLTGRLFAVGLLVAAPVMAVAFLINLVFSVLARAVPQMNVFVESFAFRSLTGLAVMGLSLTLMAQHVANWLRQLPTDVVRLTRLLAG